MRVFLFNFIVANGNEDVRLCYTKIYIYIHSVFVFRCIIFFFKSCALSALIICKVRDVRKNERDDDLAICVLDDKFFGFYYYYYAGVFNKIGYLKIHKIHLLVHFFYGRIDCNYFCKYTSSENEKKTGISFATAGYQFTHKAQLNWRCYKKILVICRIVDSLTRNFILEGKYVAWYLLTNGFEWN